MNRLLKYVLGTSFFCVSVITVFVASGLFYGHIHRQYVQDDINVPVFVTWSKEVRNGLQYQSGSVHLPKKMITDLAYSFYLTIHIVDRRETEVEMFQICTTLKSAGSPQFTQCRLTMLPPQSYWVRKLRNTIKIPLCALGLMDETNAHTIILISGYGDENIHDVSDVVIKLESEKVYHTSIDLRIAPEYHGIRYVVFHWPMLCFIVGTLAIGCLATMLQLGLFTLFFCYLNR